MYMERLPDDAAQESLFLRERVAYRSEWGRT
jgi:hypothetical protein